MAIVYNTKIVRDGLVLHIDPANTKCYPGTGTTITDLSTNRYTNTMENTNLGLEFSSADKSFLFGADDSDGGDFLTGQISLERQAIQDASPTGSMSVWFRAARDFTGDKAIFETRENRDRAIWIDGSLNNDAYGVGQFNGTEPDNGVQRLYSTTAPSDNINKWMNVTHTYSLNDGSNHIQKIYVNGVLEGTLTKVSTTDAGNAVNSFLGGTELAVGTIVPDGGHFEGDISIFLVYNRILTDSEVKQNFDAYRDRYGI